MESRAGTATELLMRAVYSARGFAYLTLGVVALFAALNGGGTQGPAGAMELLVRQQAGRILLAVVATGLLAYASWQLFDSTKDPERYVIEPKSLDRRIEQAASGLAHAVLGLTTIIIVEKSSASGIISSTGNWTAAIMQYPAGRFLILIAGMLTLALAASLFNRSWKAAYRKDIARCHIADSLEPALRFGLAAHGIVLVIAGGLLAWAAAFANTFSAAGVSDVLRLIESQPFGRLLLALTSAGLAAFSVYCFVMALYRKPPRLAPNGKAAQVSVGG